MKEEFIISIICLLIYLIFKTKKAFHMLQQNWYDKSYRYLRWMFKNLKKVFLEIDTLIFLVLIINHFYAFKHLTYIFGILYLLFTIAFIYKSKKEQVKKAIVYTARIKRLILTMLIIYLIPLIIILSNFQVQKLANYYLIFSIMAYLNYFVVLIANRINMPIEKMVYFYYLNKAKTKLAAMPNLKIIGITGSYGKTTSKNILNDILSTEFNTLASPLNYNTPYGLMRTVNNYLDKFTDIFIAEMSTSKKGDIRKLAKIFKPQYAILTKIGVAHLETLGSQENIQKEKFSLIESLPENGIAVLNKDDEWQVNYKIKNNCRVIWVGIDNDADIRATNIKLSYEGSTFDCIIKGQKYHFTTKLLGKTNIYNILAAIALGVEFGIENAKLEMAVRRVKPTEHRLELKKYKNINIIDDAYNSNPVGSKMAVEVLGLMPGKKIIVTPGMVDLGEKQEELNKQFGEYIASVADEVILVGAKITKPIYEGLKNKKYNEKQIHVIDDVKLAFSLMEKLQGEETYVLLENDLPDIFNEK